MSELLKDRNEYEVEKDDTVECIADRDSCPCYSNTESRCAKSEDYEADQFYHYFVALSLTTINNTIEREVSFSGW